VCGKRTSLRVGYSGRRSLSCAFFVVCHSLSHPSSWLRHYLSVIGVGMNAGCIRINYTINLIVHCSTSSHSSCITNSSSEEPNRRSRHSTKVDSRRRSRFSCNSSTRILSSHNSLSSSSNLVRHPNRNRSLSLISLLSNSNPPHLATSLSISSLCSKNRRISNMHLP
jgi:hypothetical protein